MSIDYSMFERSRVSREDIGTLTFDVLISAFNDSNRVTTVYDEVRADRKIWLVHHEYGYKPFEMPGGAWSTSQGEGELDAWYRFFSESGISTTVRLGIDITGMMRPHLLVLPLVLKRLGFSEATFLYADPVAYSSGQSTTFAKGPVERVDVVPGYAGQRQTSMRTRDCLVIGAGYDHELVQAAAENKPGAEHFLLVGMPSLQPHMYQESVSRIAKVKESINDFRARSLIFAPANNPFMTAQVLSDHVQSERNRGRADNIYLAPIGAKAQVLGFAWYYLCEYVGSNVSIIFPYSDTYSRETSKGISALHSYRMELDAIMDPVSDRQAAR